MKDHHLHIQPLVYVVRVFEAGKSYENKDPYAGVFTVQMIAPGRAHVASNHGIMTRAIWRQIKNWLASEGVETITYDACNGGTRTVETGK